MLDLFQVHLVCDVPSYRESRLTAPRSVSLTVRSGDRESDAVSFTYTSSTTGGATDSAPAAAAAAAAAATSSSDDTGKSHTGPPGLLHLCDRVAPSSAEGL